jgi:hypothetical protein
MVSPGDILIYVTPFRTVAAALAVASGPETEGQRARVDLVYVHDGRPVMVANVRHVTATTATENFYAQGPKVRELHGILSEVTERAPDLIAVSKQVPRYLQIWNLIRGVKTDRSDRG